MGNRVDGDAFCVVRKVIILLILVPREQRANYYYNSTLFTLILVSSDTFKSISQSYVWYVLAGFIFACGIWHAAHIKLITKREFMVIEKSWKTRIGGWVFEQQYGIPAPSLNRDEGLDIEAM